jgi:flagellar hook-associated protein 3 FlgL
MRVNPNITPDILSAIWNTQQQENTAMQQLSTGKRVNSPSDDPAAAAALVGNLTESDQTDQFIKNTSNVEGMLQTADSTLSSVVSVLNQAISLGVQGATGTMSLTDQQGIAQQIVGIQKQVMQLANTSYQGVYIFAGTASTQPPFVTDTTQPSGVAYQGNSNTNTVEIGTGRSIQTNIPGDQMFQGAGGDVMGSLQNLVTALQSGNNTAIGTATTQLRDAFNYVTQQRVFYGNAVDQLNSNSTYLQSEKVNLASQQNDLVGVDMAKAATDLSNAEITHQAALAAAARVSQNTLLDYLK